MKLSSTQHRVLMSADSSLCKEIKQASEFEPDHGKEVTASVVTQMQKILDHAESQERDLNDTEQESFKALGEIKAQIQETTLSSAHYRAPVGNSYHSRKPGGWYDKNNQEVKCFAPSQKVFSGRMGSDLAGLSVGSLIKGAFSKGPIDPRVKAALSEGTGSAGGFTVPTPLLEQLIDNLRNQSRVISAGAQTVMLNSDTTTVARLATDPTAGWRAENAAVAESDPTFEAVTFQANSLAVFVKVSNELLQDSVNIEQALNQALVNALALELDRVCLVGSGASNQPEGIHGQTNVGTIDQGTNGSAITDYTELLDALEDLDEANAGDMRGVILAPREFRTYQGFTDANNNPLTQPRTVADLPFYRTNQAPIDQTKGTATDASTIFVGDWSQLMIGMRQELEISINPFLYQGNLQTGFFATLRADIQLAHPESFVTIDGVIP